MSSRREEVSRQKEVPVIKCVTDILNDPGFRSELNQIRAKALLYEITHEFPVYKWTYVPGRFVRNCTAAAWGLETYFLGSGVATPELQLDARELAYVWESLAQLGEMVDQRSALLNTAITYELAKEFELNTDKMRRLLEKLERKGTVRRFPRAGYVWFLK